MSEDKQVSKFTASRIQLEALKKWQSSKMFCCNAPRELKVAVKKAIRDLQPPKPKKDKKKDVRDGEVVSR